MNFVSMIQVPNTLFSLEQFSSSQLNIIFLETKNRKGHICPFENKVEMEKGAVTQQNDHW